MVIKVNIVMCPGWNSLTIYTVTWLHMQMCIQIQIQNSYWSRFSICILSLSLHTQVFTTKISRENPTEPTILTGIQKPPKISTFPSDNHATQCLPPPWKLSSDNLRHWSHALKQHMSHREGATGYATLEGGLLGWPMGKIFWQTRLPYRGAWLTPETSDYSSPM